VIDVNFEESLIIKNIIKKIPAPKNVLDIGSSTHKYRTATQPYIDKNIFLPLRNYNAEITYLDIIEGIGVDVVADISSESFSLHHKYDLVLCNSLLQFITDIKTCIFNISSTVCDGGYLIISAPLKFPFHDPSIDALNRFTPNELSNLFSIYSFHTIYSHVLRKKLSITNWIKLSFESFLLILIWRNFKALWFNVKQCISPEMKYSIMLFRAPIQER